KEPAASWYSHHGDASRPPVLPHIQPPEPQPEEEKLESLPEDAILTELPADAIVTEPVQFAAAAVEAEEAPLPAAAWDDVPEPPPPPERDESPLDFKQALQALAGVSDRDSIAHIVLRASRSKAARARLLQAQAGGAAGWGRLG